ncbi:hypothetical protein ACFPTO_06630 [Paraburkholderia denitrificans]|uniref:DUF222 domain-containing protein n=1 Tax=Paraburkholderia denitrificans TaxID=694025 RepID=A0ABW0J634_9BURK
MYRAPSSFAPRDFSWCLLLNLQLENFNMKCFMQPLPVRLAALESLVSETGLADELHARKRADTDKRRADIAVQLNGLPNPERELAALAKSATQARAAHEKAALELLDAERRDNEARTRYVMASFQAEGKRNALLLQLELSAPPELADALDDLSFAGQLLRGAVHTDVTASRTWTGAVATKVTTNLDAIAAARDQLTEATRKIRALAHDGTLPSEVLADRCAEIMNAALEPAFAFIPRDKWDLRYERPASDLVVEVANNNG